VTVATVRLMKLSMDDIFRQQMIVAWTFGAARVLDHRHKMARLKIDFVSLKKRGNEACNKTTENDLTVRCLQEAAESKDPEFSSLTTIQVSGHCSVVY
jgi:hypothetical protein